MSSSNIYTFATLKQHSMLTCRQNKYTHAHTHTHTHRHTLTHTHTHPVDAENAISNCKSQEKFIGLIIHDKLKVNNHIDVLYKKQIHKHDLLKTIQ